ncbi:aspartate-semialdehyde dehydrogenase [Aureibacillus halotolerans]|uniref:Aspartate-semialdehyde dehydrogenase n=1 Tax=Aureibacillus halotolerans TaxID=1508390 RepID=A0A4R6U539_9BACI|nr:aspartate-semialdehyde dehydrogenase [Aureibacillus halotolerans]TDQ39699.1 aspartate semialdehyde dehydrogenase [Aureibacillus halotolerans]
MNTQQTYHVAVVGATGAVGEKMLETLSKRSFPIGKLTLLSSKRSAGKTLVYNNETYEVQEATPESFAGVDIALFSAGGSVSKKLAPEAVKHGAIVIDNTSAFRMDTEVPLVVPEVNPEDLTAHKGIIANPNCSTIQMVAALKPIKERYGLSRVIVSTYQAVSGAGTEAIEEMKQQSRDLLDGKAAEPKILPVGGDKKHYQIAFNAIPQIDVFQDNGYTFEEMKMINETKKILHDEDLSVSATCVRLPVASGHAESVYIETEATDVTAEEIKALLQTAEGVTLQDDPSTQTYPMPALAEGKDDVFVGRVRKDPDVANGIHLWVVSDNLLKGAALNSVQIAERMIEMKLLNS